MEAQVEGDMDHAGVQRGPWDEALDDACGPGGLTQAGERMIVRWPYLQKVTASKAEVLWTSDTDEPIEVEVSRPDGTVIARAASEVDTGARPPAGRQHVARLSDLDPDATLCYRLVGAEGVLLDPTGFRTAPRKDSDTPVRLVALGDLGTQTSDQYAVLEQLETVAFDLAIITGDVAYDDGTRRELEENFFGVYRDLLTQVPFFVASGNHDYNTEDARPFREAFALFENGGPEGLERWYSFDWGRVHFVVLDTERVDRAQVEWLEQDLAANDSPFTVAVAHRPPYSSGTHGSDLGVREAFSPVFARYGVQLVLLGHEHDYERTRSIDGVTYVVTGGGGRGTRPVGESDFTAVSDRVAHFVYVEVDGDTMRMVAIDAAGKEFDSWAFELDEVS